MGSSLFFLRSVSEPLFAIRRAMCFMFRSCCSATYRCCFAPSVRLRERRCAISAAPRGVEVSTAGRAERIRLNASRTSPNSPRATPADDGRGVLRVPPSKQCFGASIRTTGLMFDIRSWWQIMRSM